MEIEFSTLRYKDWVEVIFNRPVGEKEPTGDMKAAWPPEQPLTLVKHLTRLCREFSSLRNRFSWGQINQGVWAVLMHPVEAVQYLMKNEIPDEARSQCIRSMLKVFSCTVATIPTDTPMENCFFMWWDIVAGGFCSHCDHRTDDPFVPKEESDRRTHDVIFETLVQVLSLDDGRCQNCALHGLGHLHQPRFTKWCGDLLKPTISETLLRKVSIGYFNAEMGL